MDNLIPKDKTNALLALDHGRRKISLDKELIVDYRNNKLYYNKESAIIELSKEIKDRLIEEGMTEILGVSVTGEDFIPIISNIINNELWVESITKPKPSGVNTTSQLSYFLKGTSKFTIKELLDDLVDNEEGKVLSDNNLTGDEVKKIKTIEFGARNYKHPKNVQCKISTGVTRLNGYPQQGESSNVNLTTHDIGLGNIDPHASKYEHPDYTVCNAEMIVSLNDKSGDVELTKAEFGLPDMENMQLAHPDNYKSDITYCTPAIVSNYLDDITNDRNSEANYIYPLGNGYIMKVKHNKNNTKPEYIMYNSLTKTNKNINTFSSFSSYNYTNETNTMLLIEENKLKTYTLDTKGEFIDNSNNDLYKTGDFTKINQSNLLSVVDTQNKDMYGVCMSHNTDGHTVHIWGKVKDTFKLNRRIEKAVFRDDILYVLLDNGTMKYKEYGKAVLNPRVREMILSYNNILDIRVLKDYAIVVRATRKIIASGTNEMIDRINLLKSNIFKSYFTDTASAFITIDNNITLLGKIEPSWNNIKLDSPPKDIYINGKNLYIIDENNKMSVYGGE